MTKFRDAGAYEVAEGVFTAEEAAKQGLAVVEVNPTSGAPTAYGRYKGAPSGSPLGITVDDTNATKVVGGGEVGPKADQTTTTADKGSLVNLDDPFVRQEGDESIHEDGAAPGKLAEEIDDAPLVEAAKESLEKAPTRNKTK